MGSVSLVSLAVAASATKAVTQGWSSATMGLASSESLVASED